MLCGVVLFCDLLCGVVLCGVVLCCAVLCGVVLCCLLCCAVCCVVMRCGVVWSALHSNVFTCARFQSLRIFKVVSILPPNQFLFCQFRKMQGNFGDSR